MAETAMTPPATPSGNAVTRSTKDLTKAAVSGWLGTAMEFMDFQLYSLAAAIVFNEIFFPGGQPGDRPDRRHGHLRRRLRGAAGGRHLLRPHGRPARPPQGPVHHRRAHGRLHDADRRAADLPDDRHHRADPAGRAAPGPGLRRGRRDRRRHGDARRVRARPTPRPGRVAGLARHQLRHPGGVGPVGAAARRAQRGAAAQLGLAAAVPAQLRTDDLRGLDPHQRQGEPGLRGPRRRRRRRRPHARRARQRRGQDLRRGAGAPGRPQAAQGQGVLPGAGPAVRPGGQLGARADLPGRLRRHHPRDGPRAGHRGHHVGLHRRLRHRARDRHARRPVRPAARCTPCSPCSPWRSRSR